MLTYQGQDYDCKPKPGGVHRFYFCEEDPPPFYDLNAPKVDVVTTKTNRKGTAT